MSVRLLTWNVRFGGRKKRRQIVDAISAVNADIVALSEWLPGRDSVGDELDELLDRAGYNHVVIPPAPPAGDYGAAIASRWPVHPLSAGPPAMEHRWAHGAVETPEGRLEVAAVYVPTGARDAAIPKNAFLKWLVDTTPSLLYGSPIVITGDFNCDHADDTGQYSRLVRNRWFDALFEAGWVDMFRQIHPPATAASWWSNHGRGFRIDHALAGPGGPQAHHMAYLDDDGNPVGVAAPTRWLSDHVRLVSELVVGTRS